MIPKKALTVAGSDCSGGAGIQADLKTFQERDVYGMSVVTVLVAMRPENWDHVVHPIDLDMIKTQFRTIFPGIGADAAKTGMLPTVDIIRTVGELFAEAKIPHLVIDPVMVCKGTSEPLFPENTRAMIEYLLPIAEVVTPNTFEAAQLAGMEDLKNEKQVEEAARRIYQHGCKNVLIKVAVSCRMLLPICFLTERPSLGSGRSGLTPHGRTELAARFQPAWPPNWPKAQASSKPAKPRMTSSRPAFATPLR